MKSKTVIILLLIISGISVKAALVNSYITDDTIKINEKHIPKIEIDLMFGVISSYPKFHHAEYVKETSEYRLDFGSSYSIGITSRIKNNLYLRTEIGIMRTHTSFNIEYDDPILGNREELSMMINNVRGYFGLIPEFRYNNNNVSLKLFAGPIITTNLVNTSVYYGDNKEMSAEYLPFGFKTGAGVIVRYESLGLTCNIAYVNIARGTLYNFEQPRISYNQIHINAGVVYPIK